MFSAWSGGCDRSILALPVQSGWCHKYASMFNVPERLMQQTHQYAHQPERLMQQLHQLAHPIE